MAETSQRLAQVRERIAACRTPPDARHELRLGGCATTPLASYLKALGILRVVAEQADADATGCWHDDTFVLGSRLDAAALQWFLLEEYEPTPLLAPWGGRSGFYPGSPESSARAALERIEQSDLDRLAPFRDGIAGVRALLARHGITDKPKEDDAKLDLLRLCRAELPDELVPWLDACYTLTGDGRAFPPLLGTGGNEGSGSYVSAFAQLVGECVIERRHDDALAAALFADPRPGTGSGQAPGQFSPLAGGGPNATTGFEGGGVLNAWDFLLCLEGTLLFAAATTKRLETAAAGTLAFPFTVHVVGAGAGSVALGDEPGARAETWFPIWERRASVQELTGVLAEGRVQVNGRTARDALDFARAVASLGLQRGITAFHRYGYMQRLGRNVLAVPIDRIEVRRNERGDLINDLEDWLGRFRQLARRREPPAPARLRLVVTRLEDALFDLTRSGEAWHVQTALIRLGEAQTYLAGSPSSREGIRPVPRLRAKWVHAADDGTAEFRIAAALAGLHATTLAGGPTLLPMAAHFAPLDGTGGWAEHDADVVWRPGPLIDSLCAIAGRRAQAASRSNLTDTPWAGRVTAPVGTVVAWLNGRYDDARIAQLIQGLVLARIPTRLRKVDVMSVPVPPAYALLKPLFATHRQLGGIRFFGEEITGDTLVSHDADGAADLDPTPDNRDGHARIRPASRDAAAIARLLAADRIGDAVERAVRRLRAWGLPPLVDFRQTEHPDGRRLLAALLAPIPSDDLRSAVRRVARRKQDKGTSTATAHTET